MQNEPQCGCDGDAAVHLRHAEQELNQALKHEREAQEEVRKAEDDVRQALEELDREKEHFSVFILYNGLKKPFQVRSAETVKQLLDQALATFGPINAPHTFALYLNGAELPDAKTLKEVGVKCEDVLLLRPSAVKGGT